MEISLTLTLSKCRPNYVNINVKLARRAAYCNDHLTERCRKRSRKIKNAKKKREKYKR